MSRRLKHWGWGYEDEQPSAQELRAAAGFLRGRLGFGSLAMVTPLVASPYQTAATANEAAPMLATALAVRVDRFVAIRSTAKVPIALLLRYSDACER